jgi:hypothetical protein
VSQVSASSASLLLSSSLTPQLGVTAAAHKGALRVVEERDEEVRPVPLKPATPCDAP